MPGLRSAIRKKSIGGVTTVAVGGRTTIQRASPSKSLPDGAIQASYSPAFRVVDHRTTAGAGVWKRWRHGRRGCALRRRAAGCGEKIPAPFFLIEGQGSPQKFFVTVLVTNGGTVPSLSQSCTRRAHRILTPPPTHRVRDSLSPRGTSGVGERGPFARFGRSFAAPLP